MAGIYVHVPFCKRKCGYCDFYSIARTDLIQNYLSAIEKELFLRRNYLDGEIVQTIYFGGGTPSLLQSTDIQQIINFIKNNFDISPETEITIEANPDDLTENYIMQLTETDVNRLSIGIQSFDDAQLHFMNRRHTAQQAIDAVKCCQKHSFSNISIDLIYGLPQMSIEQWCQQLKIAERLGVQHLSAYHLTYEEGTAFGQKLKKQQITEISEDESLAQFEILTNWAKMAQFEHYEISNFAKSGYQSRHNSSYWNRTKYLGIGPAAHSYNQVARSWNIANVKMYIAEIEKGKLPSEIETLSESDKFNDYVITALRTSAGIDLQFLQDNFQKSKIDYLLRQADSFLKSNKLEFAENHLKLTHNGIFISDEIMEALIVIE